MKNLAILSIVAMLLLSGCVQRVDFEDGPPQNEIDNPVDVNVNVTSVANDTMPNSSNVSAENIEKGYENIP